MIVALAGRRIDAEDAAVPRFPLERRSYVRKRIRTQLELLEASALISSAACGADLLAQDVARTLGLRRHIVLPFSRERFRATSVVDRPGRWGHLFDTICDQMAREGGLTVLSSDPGEEAAYKHANQEILAQTLRLAQAQAPGEFLAGQAVALLVWDGVSRGPEDLTAALGASARAQGLRVVEVLTLRPR